MGYEIDVLLLTIGDWSNTGWRMTKCLQKLGLNVMSFKAQMHPFYYPEQIIVHPDLIQTAGQVMVTLVGYPALKSLVEKAKVVHFTASSFIDVGIDLTKKNVVMQHGGGTYRQLYQSLNERYNSFANATIIQMPDLMGLGAKNEHLIYFPVDTDFIKPQSRHTKHGDKVIVGHFPSMNGFKGTDRILNVIERLKADLDVSDKFEYVGGDGTQRPIIWLDNLDRVSKCDIIIDVFAERAQGCPYGEWGNASFEAAAMGKVVCTMSQHYDIYIDNYGESQLCITNDENELFESLKKNILDIYAGDFTKGEMARNWVVEKHSIQATANRLWDLVYKDFF